MATKKASSSAKPVSKKKITEEDIRKKAQKIYEARMKKGTPGSAHTDWAQAEKELKK